MLNPDPQPICGVLYVDDEEKALKYFRMAFSEKFEIFTATSAAEGLEILVRESAKIGIVLSDQRMPTTVGAEFLGVVREQYPRIVRILTTAFSDLKSAIAAVNRGHIYQYVVKPWEIADLGMVLQRAADYHRVLSERDALLAVKLTTLQRILCSDRVKWLLLRARSLEVAERSAFLRALAALIKALPEDLDPVPAWDGAALRHFEIGALIRAEYANATRSLDQLAAFSSGGGAGIPESLSAPLAVHPLLDALLATPGVSADSLSVESNGAAVRVRVSPNGAPPSALRSSLFGLLVERETSAPGVALLATLGHLARSGGSLVLTIGGEEFQFGPAASDSADEIIDSLYEKFAAADISRL